jgi:hypothetical protein
MSNQKTPDRTPANPVRMLPAHIDEKAAATVLGLSVRTLQQWRVKGGGPPFGKFGANVRYNPEALARWIAANTATTTSGGPRAA